MIHFFKALSAWGQHDFTRVLQSEIERLPHDVLPLQEGLRLSNAVSEEPIQAMILRVNESGERIVAVATLFYSGVIAGCSCADDPTPLDTQAESCQLEIRLDKRDASVEFLLCPEDEH